MAEVEESSTLYADLRQQIGNDHAVAVVGAGVSIAATRENAGASWAGLLRSGLTRCQEVAVPKPTKKSTGLIREEINSGEIDNLLSAAEKISNRLHAPGAEFARWLRETVGSLTPEDQEVIRAIESLQIPIVTTNYDSLIEEVTKLPAITWRQKTKTERWLRGEEPGILHIHGHWEDPESVILGTTSYQTIINDSFAQGIMRTLRITKTLVFIGYGGGLEDPNFSLLFKWARELLSDSEYRLYRLVLEKDLKAIEDESIPADRLYPLSYGTEHSHLPEYLRRLAPTRPSDAIANGLDAGAGEEVSDPKFPGCAFRTRTISSSSVMDAINTYQKYFHFRWERSSFQYSDASPIVYWPVRLRQPTPIHAVQCFAAAGLQRLGAEVFLCLDDLGHKDYQVSRFFETIRQWFDRVGGESGVLRERQFTEMIGSDNAADAWTHVRKWLGDTLYFLDKILAISKLIPTDQNTPITVRDLAARRPRRLLTPPVVWAGLSHILQQNDDRSILTLGGFDERALWKAWRECIDIVPRTGHLYIPELIQPSAIHGDQAVHMETTPLGWESREDISKTLASHVASIEDGEDWKLSGRMIPWCMTGCVLLPEFVKNGLSMLRTFEIQPGAEPIAIVPSLVDILDWWLLSHD